MPGTHYIWVPFSIHECDSENRPGETAIERYRSAKEALSFEPRIGKLYAIRFEGRFYSFPEFKRLVEAGEII